jgi:hypothetical protein
MRELIIDMLLGVAGVVVGAMALGVICWLGFLGLMLWMHREKR